MSYGRDIIVEVKGLTKASTFVVAAASGAAGFLYLVVWMRRVALTFGDTTFVTATAISAFLGGVALGARIWGQLADRRPRSSLMICAGLGLATGGYGVASLWILDGVEALCLFVYPRFADHGIFLAIAQIILIAVFIFPAAVLMGGLPPLLARGGLSDNSKTAERAGAVYGWSALGAALGAVMTTYVLLPGVGLRSTILLAAGINVLVSAAAFWVGMRLRRGAEPLNRKGSAPSSGLAAEPSAQLMKVLFLLAFAVAGFAVVIFQVAWVRLIAMVIGPSIYVYGVWVVVALTGIGIGSILYGVMRRAGEEHRRWLAGLEFLLALTMALAMIFFPRIPYLFAHFFPLFRNSFGRQILAQFVAMAIGTLLPALFFGAIFPAAVGSIGGGAARFGSTIGAACIVGAIGVTAGAWLAEFVFLPRIGLEATMRVGVLAAAGAGVAVWWRSRAPKAPAGAGVITGSRGDAYRSVATGLAS